MKEEYCYITREGKCKCLIGFNHEGKECFKVGEYYSYNIMSDEALIVKGDGLVVQLDAKNQNRFELESEGVEMTMVGEIVKEVENTCNSKFTIFTWGVFVGAIINTLLTIIARIV